MADHPLDTLQEKLRLLGASYAAQLPEKIQQLEADWRDLLQAWDGEKLQMLHRNAHSLTGSGATFGFVEVSKLAHVLEQTLKELINHDAPASAGQQAAVLRQMEDLKREVLGHENRAGSTTDLGTVAQPVLEKHCATLVFVVDDDKEVSQGLALQLENFGFKVMAFNALPEFSEAIKHSPQAVVLMDIEFPGNILGGIEAVNEMQQVRDVHTPVLFISSHAGLDTRLAAVSAGGMGYFTKPVNIGNLIDKLDELTAVKPQEAFRVLIIDDEEQVSAYHSAILKQAGIVVRVVNDPMRTMGALLEFDPDIILMDLYMPECNGLELAKVIRQMDDFVSIPIVFLSAESNLDKQFSAMAEVGDDFLIKPIQPVHLVSAVTSRIHRSRLLRSFMVRDSLTGLLNHTSVKEQLNREVARARRNKTPLSFAMVDIDHFKQVNDSYGHFAGDRVIKSISRLLRQRLRDSDVVGRYGGEEFAVILSGTAGEAAVRVLDEIRISFSKLQHSSEGREFSVTFSCGVAEISVFNDEVQLGEAADKALYQAKNAGRNCVILAQPSM